jgi:succinate-semialdehyde dehydrogenase/glutarate-semialdehyde dehydrogenase
MTIATINPATGETVKTFEPDSERVIEQVLTKAASAYKTHRRLPFAERAALMNRAADILEEEKNALGKLMTLEMVKPTAAAIA